MDQAGDRDLRPYKEKIKNSLNDDVVFDPSAAWRVGDPSKMDSRLQNGNVLVLGQADVMLAWLPHGVPTIGTPMEIQHALSRGIPVAVLGPQNSWALTGDNHLRVFAEEDLAEAISWLKEMNLQYKRDVELAPALPGTFNVQPVREDEPSNIPTLTHRGDAGFDLYVTRKMSLLPGEFQDVAHNIRICLPPMVWAQILGRSSTIRRRGLLVHTGVIDAGYRGELFTGVTNMSKKTVQLDVGERVSQLILLPLISSDWPPRWGTINHTERGEGRFGSSGD
ncbi:MAG: dCTP deaminase domain-containing protein [Candidatus Saccharimonadales bacterium]